MDEDYLIHAGSGLDQVTWMDVRVGDWVATPRHGKPVEINALWYNALCVTAELAEHFKEDSSVYRKLATRVSASFRKEFWNEKDGCLYDVIEENGKDAPWMPNQYFAALTNMRSVGVMGDERTYDYAVALRAVTTIDFMTAESAEIPYEVLNKVMNRIINEVRGVNRVMYDLTSKPPGTIEFE